MEELKNSENTIDNLIEKGDKFRSRQVNFNELSSGLRLSDDLKIKSFNFDINRLYGFMLLTIRILKCDVRSPMSFSAKFGQFLIVLLFQYLLYGKLGSSSSIANNIMDTAGFYYLMVSFITLSSLGTSAI